MSEATDHSSSGYSAFGATDDEICEAIRSTLGAIAESERLGQRGRLSIHSSRELIDRVAVQLEGARARLRQAVETMAAQRKKQGVSPEATIVAVKTVVAAAMPHDIAQQRRQALESDAVLWAIEAYYSAA